VIKFHQTYYRPDNATLIVIGDFDQKQLDTWVDKYCPIPKPNLPLPRVNIAEPARTGESGLWNMRPTCQKGVAFTISLLRQK
jgi:zinc protease